MVENLYQKGIVAAEAGDLPKANRLLAQYLHHNPKSEKGWLALGHYVKDTNRKEYCFEKVLSLNPENEIALSLLKELREPATQDTFFSDEKLSEAWESEEDNPQEQFGEADFLDPNRLKETSFEEERPSGFTWEEEQGQDHALEEEEQHPFFSEEELSGAWESEKEDSQEQFDEADFLDPNRLKEASFEEERPSGSTWEEEQGQDDALEEEEHPFFSKEELSGWELEDESEVDKVKGTWTGDWENDKGIRESWGENNLSSDQEEPQARWQEKNTSKKDILEEREELFKESKEDDELRDDWDINKGAFTREKGKRKTSKFMKSCLSKSLALVFGLVAIILLLGVAAILLVDTGYLPDFIDPYLSSILPTSEATEVVATTEIAKNTKTPIKMPNTWTPTPSLTPSVTPRYTLTPTSTATPIYTATPTPVDEFVFTVVDDEEGWSRYTYPANAFSISVPPAWAHLDLGVDELEEMLAQVAINYPGIEQFYSGDSLRKSRRNGVKFLAVDGTAIETGENFSIEVLVSDLQYDVDLNTFVDENIQGLKESISPYLNVEEKRIEIAGVEAAEITYEIELTYDEEETIPMMLTQYLLIAKDDETAYVLTFSTNKETFETKYPQIFEIAQGFEFTE